MSDCGTPPEIAGGFVKEMNNTGVTYSCRGSYRLTGNPTILCVNNAWEITTELPACKIYWKNRKETMKTDVYSDLVAEIPDWLVAVYATLTAWVAIVFLTCLILMVITLMWRCRGKVIDIDGTHVYPEQLICRYLCCCFRIRRDNKKFSHRDHLMMVVENNRRAKKFVSKVTASRVNPTKAKTEEKVLLVPPSKNATQKNKSVAKVPEKTKVKTKRLKATTLMIPSKK